MSYPCHNLAISASVHTTAPFDTYRLMTPSSIALRGYDSATEWSPVADLDKENGTVRSHHDTTNSRGVLSFVTSLPTAAVFPN